MWAQEQFSLISNKDLSRIQYQIDPVSSGAIDHEFNANFDIWSQEQFSLISNEILWRVRYKIGHVSLRTVFFDF